MCSSTASVLGGRGKIVYAAANRMLDAHAGSCVPRAANACRSSGASGPSIRARTAPNSDLAEIGYLPMRSADVSRWAQSKPETQRGLLRLGRARAVLRALGYGPTLSIGDHAARPPRLAEPPQRRVGPTSAGADLLAEVIGADDVRALDTSSWWRWVWTR